MMCGSGCSSSPCEHNGKCIEKWDHYKFYCDCRKTNFIGDQCQKGKSKNILWIHLFSLVSIFVCEEKLACSWIFNFMVFAEVCIQAYRKFVIC